MAAQLAQNFKSWKYKQQVQMAAWWNLIKAWKHILYFLFFLSNIPVTLKIDPN